FRRVLFRSDTATERRIDVALAYELVVGVGLVVVCAVATLKTFLACPVVAQIDHDVIACGAGADDNHAAGLTHENTCGYGQAARMLEHDRRILAFAGDLPDALTEFACLGGPFLLAGGVVDQGWDSPVAELITVDVADRAEFFRILPALVIGNDSDRLGAGMRG